MDRNALTAQYQERASVCRQLGPVMENLVRQLLDAADVRVHSVNHRVKQSSSFARKISRPGTEYASIDEIHDILGLRVVTYFPDEVDRVAGVIEEHFLIDGENSVDKRVLLDPDRFGYLSLHYVCSLNEARASLVEHSRFAGLKCEIQIRSILQHAWADIEHDLGYATSQEIPAGLRRRFYRLAGLLEIADSEFQVLRDEVGSYQKQARKQVTRKPESVPIDRDTIEAYVGTSATVSDVCSFMAGYVGAEAEPITVTYAGMLVSALIDVGLTTIGEIEAELDARREMVKQFFAEWADPAAFADLSRGAVLFYLAYVLACYGGDKATVIAYLEPRHFRQAPPDLAEALLQAYARAEIVLRENGGAARGLP